MLGDGDAYYSDHAKALMGIPQRLSWYTLRPCCMEMGRARLYIWWREGLSGWVRRARRADNIAYMFGNEKLTGSSINAADADARHFVHD